MKRKLLPFIFASILFAIFVFAIIFYLFFPLKFVKIIGEYSDKNNLDKSLVCAVIFAESHFDKKAKSSSGACGLMQLMPTTFDWSRQQIDEQVDNDIFDERANIACGCYYLSYLFEKYQNKIFVLASYNAGESVVKTWGSPENFETNNIKFSETREYVKKILFAEKIYASRI